jgi:hypothetical protein
MGASQRRKGHNYEREIARVFREIYPGARRGLQYRDGSEAADVEGTPFHIECKRGKAISVFAALKQAEAAASRGMVPIVVAKRDRERDVVMLSLEDFLELIRENEERGEA